MYHSGTTMVIGSNDSSAVNMRVSNNSIGTFDANGLSMIVTGTQSSPAMRMGQNGLYQPATNTVGFVANAAERMRLNVTGLGVGNNNPEYRLQVSSGGFVCDGTSAYGRFVYNTSTPSASATQAQIWAVDVDGSAEMKVQDGAGNITTISPHNNDGDWIFYSENTRTGKRVYVNMERFIRKMEEVAGEKFLFDTYGGDEK